MRLCFIWIERFKGLSDISLNLSPEFKFKFDFKSTSLIKGINEQFISNLFSPTISSVTAIVGKNGSGKSNCLELICTVLDGSIHRIDTNFISVIEHDGTFYINHSFEEGFKASFPYLIIDDKKKAKGLNTILFSNVHDERLYQFTGDVIAVTANNGYGYGRYLNVKIKNSESLFSTQLNLIIKHNKILNDEIKIEIPQYISIDFRFIFSYRKPYHGGEFFRAFRKRISDMTSYESKLLCMIKYTFLIQLIDIKELYFRNQKTKNLEFKINELTDSFLNNSIIEIINEIKELESESEFTNTTFNDLFKKIKDNYENLIFINKEIDQLSVTLIDNPINLKKESFKISFNKKNHRIIKRICEISDFNKTIRMDWIGISSGTKAYLTLLSVLYDKLLNKKNDHLICIDEGDLYLHPAWQIDFLYNLNKILPKFSSSQIQLVLTSHSPFLLTDLPRENIIIIDDKKVIEDNGLDEKLKTFGSNIYELYNNAFFLEGKRFGSFAEEHISNIINKIEKNTNKDSGITNTKDIENIDKIEKLINIIGDNLLRNSLKRLIKND